MMLQSRWNIYNPQPFNLTGATVLNSQQQWPVDRTWPIEGFILTVNFTVGTQLTLVGPDNILGIVKKIRLATNDGVQPRDQVNISGIGALELGAKWGLNIDPATWEAVLLSQGTTIAAASQVRISYFVPIVHPMITEPLRTKCLLPCHRWSEDMNLILDFENPANMFSAGTITAVGVEVKLLRRELAVNSALDQAIIKDGGYIRSDLLESQNPIPLLFGGELKFRVPTPGSYTALLFRQYRGGATITRDVVDQVVTPNAETKWRLEVGGTFRREWRWRTVQTMNAWSNPHVRANQTYAPNFAGAIAANTNWQPAASVMLDYLSDGWDSASELGSVLDCNLPQQTGQLVEVIGNVASVGTNASVMNIIGHRLYGDLSKYQALRAS